MTRSFLKLIPLLITFFSVNVNAQNQASELLFVITAEGDSLVASKILKSGTHEEQVTFIFEGKRKVLKSHEVKSYYKKGRRISIDINSGNQNKLVKIVVRGPVKLAQAFTSRGIEKFYLLVNEKWIDLDPHAYHLKEYLSELLPNFGREIKKEKIHYDLPSLGKAILQYNRYLNPDSKVNTSFNYTERIKFGVFGSFGLINIKNNKFHTELEESSIAKSFGLSTHIQYNRLFSIRLQAGYAQSMWSNKDWLIKLRTLNLNSLVCVPVYSKSKNFKISTGIGINLNTDLNSKILGPEFKVQYIGLGGLGFGYEFQLHACIQDRFEMFFSSQIMTKQKTQDFGFLGSFQFFRFKTYQFRLGASIYL